MEGYTNINANLHNFDDLDIEGRIVDDWNQDEECPSGIKKNEHKRILETKVRLDDGSFGEMCSVVKKQHGFSYTCHVCTTTCSGWPQFKIHLGSSKHLQYMQLPEHPRNKFVKLDPNEDMALEPGEPVPPGLEEVVISNCQIQPVIDNYKSGPLVGLEYLVEYNGFDELEYTCLLCDKVGKSRSIMGHMTSQGHYRKYIATFFRSAVKLYNEDLPRNRFYRQRCVEVVTRIARKIESKYGRMKPRYEPASSFATRKREVLREIEEGHHFRETPDDRFDDCLLVTTQPGIIYKGASKTGEKDSTFSSNDTLTDVSQTKARNNNEDIDIPLPEEEINTKKNTLIAGNPENASTHKGDELSKSLFNKGKINADKRQLRSRDESNAGKKSSSPEIIQVDIKPPSVKKYRKSHSTSPISLSTASLSSSRSKSRGRSPIRIRPKSPHRSRARSPYRSRYRSRSRNRSYGSRYARRSRSSSARRYRMRRRSRSRGHYRSKSRSRSRSPSYADRFGRTISLKRRDSSADYRSKKKKYLNDRPSGEEDGLKTEKRKWEKFREEYHEAETALFDKLKYFEKNPEKHPQYPEEWKVFWNKRYKEIQSEGKDPAKHDFKPEWIVFWTKRMKEIHENDLKMKKESLKHKFNLPSEEKKSNVDIKESHSTLSMLEDVSPPTPDKKDVIADIKNTWKALTGSDIKESKRPLSPWEEESKPQEQFTDKRELRSDHYRESHRNMDRSQERIEKRACFVDNVGTVVALLRKLAVLEGSLGSLGPRVLDLLSVALAMDKVSENGSQALLHNNEHCVFLETVKEKLKGLLFAGVVARNMVNTTRSAIRSIDHLFAEAPKYKGEPFGKPIMIPVTSTAFKPDPVSVPGVGKVDKVAIAQQIAATLIQQGRTNVTEGELGQLINAVVGMAEASSISGQPISAAAYVSQMQFSSGPVLQMELQNKPASSSGLTLLQSAYDEIAKPDVVNLIAKVEQIANKQPNTNSIGDLSEPDLRNLIQNFNNLSSEEKTGLKTYLNKLEESSPEIIMKLKPIIPSGILTSVLVKRSPIVIPISKEKSEQRIKPVEQETGRLSPFSMRSGGINPTADTIEHELTNPSNPADKHPDDKLVAEYVGDDDEDDDDDDDYSFEDVYKAASEKLRLKQIEEEKANEAKKAETSSDTIGCESAIATDSIEISQALKSKESILSTLPEITASQTIGDSINSSVKSQEYQVNINNYTQFASSSKIYSSQQDSVSELYSDNTNCQQQNNPNYSQRMNYPSGRDLQTGVSGHGDNLNYNLHPNHFLNPDVQDTVSDHESQSGYLNRNVQARNAYGHNQLQDTVGFNSQVGYSNRNQQGDFTPNHNLQNVVSLDSQSGYSNSNLQSNFAPSRDMRYNIPSRFDVQNTLTSNGPGEEGFYTNRNPSTSLPGNYPSRDHSTDSSSHNFLPNRNNTYAGRYNDFDNGSKYTSRSGVNIPYSEQPLPQPQREGESQFYPNQYPYERNPPNNQPFKRYQNLPRF